MWGFELGIMTAMIAINSFFAGYEIALASVTLTRLQRLADEHRPGARVALLMKRNMEASLAVVQLGITLVGAIAAAVGGAGAEESIAPVLRSRLGLSEGPAETLAIALVVLPLTVVTIVFGELIPKVFALRRAEWVSLTLSPVMRVFSLSVWPAVWFLEKCVTTIMAWGERRLGKSDAMEAEKAELQELRVSAALARSSRLIGHRQEEIILGATQMHSRLARDIMIPAEHVSTLHANSSLADNLIAAHLDMHTRFPVLEEKGDPQTVIGYANVKDMIAALHISSGEPSFRSIVRTIPFFRDDQPIAECLEQFMRERTHIAAVRDPAGRIVGMVALEDILEELVGDIGDEYDRLPTHVVASGSSWVAGGGIDLERLRRTTGIDLRADPVAAGAETSTLAEWVATQLGREARGGDLVENASVRVLVRKIRRNKVQEVQISKPDRSSPGRE